MNEAVRQNKKYEVLFVGPHLNIGGDALSTIGLAAALGARGHTVSFMAPGGPLVRELRQKPIRYIEADLGGRDPIRVLRGALEIRKFLNSHPNTEIVHAQTVVPTVMTYIATRAAPSPPAIVWHNRGVHEVTYRLSRLFNLITDYVISISDYERNILLRNGVSPEKVATIHHGVYLQPCRDGADLGRIRAELGLTEHTPVVGLVGRLEPTKGQHRLLRAAPAVLREVPDARFLIVGGGSPETRADLERLSRSLEVDHSVVFTGWRRDMHLIYRLIDVLVHPSVWESLCNVLLEGMHMGKPIVAANSTAIPEVVVNGETGILVAPEDTPALAEAIVRLLKDRRLAAAMGRAGKERARRLFTVERQLDQVEAAYAEAVARSRRR